jgi:hypothetical protein
MDLGVCQVEHAFVHISDKELLAGKRDYNGGCGVRRCANPKVILECLFFNFFKHCREVFISLLSANPGFKSAGDVTFDVL